MSYNCAMCTLTKITNTYHFNSVDSSLKIPILSSRYNTKYDAIVQSNDLLYLTTIPTQLDALNEARKQLHQFDEKKLNKHLFQIVSRTYRCNSYKHDIEMINLLLV